MGLRTGDLKDLLYKIFEIDSYASKMGEDKDIVTLSFSVKDKAPAEDLMNFIEKGYDFVLDADVTPGEQSDGTYKVFVELERQKNVGKEIFEIADGVRKLSGVNDLKFRYYKGFKSMDVTEEALESTIPNSPDDYGLKVNESNLDNFKNFFNKSYVESVDLIEDELTISKKWADPLTFDVIDFDDKATMLETLEDTINVNDFAEVIFLSKYIGDYNITKFGDKFMLENKDKAVLVKRKNV